MAYKKKEAPSTTEETTVDVELNATMPNEAVGHHTAMMGYGTFVFIDGHATVSSEFVDRLRSDLVIK